MFGHFGNPAVITRIVGAAGLLQHRCFTPHEINVASRDVRGRQRVEVGRVTVVVTQIALVNGSDVVGKRPVISAAVPALAQWLGQLLQGVGNFKWRQATVGQP